MTSLTSPPVILLAFANDRADQSRYLRNLPEELRNLREALRPAVDQKLCEVVELANATADDIFQVFQTRKYRNRIAVFHFGGHAGGYQLLLESAEGQAKAANADGFAKFLAAQNSLELVFLNGCSTQQQTQGLLNAGVDAVITTGCAIDDAVATKLSERFYRALATGVGLRTAFQESVAAAETEAGGKTRALYAVSAETEEVVADRFPWEISFRPGAESAGEWNLPNTVRNPLFGLPEPPKTDLPATPYRHLHWFQRGHADVFFGRGEEIRDLYHKATDPETAPIILFYGQSGVGKSSLLDAGLLPRLEATQNVIYLRRDVEQGLSGTLDLAFLPEGVDLSPRDAWHAREKALGRPLTVVLDQVEEVFTRPCGAVSDELGMFLDHISDIFADREHRPLGRLIVGFRKEWLAEIARQLTDARLPYTTVFLEKLDRRGILEVVNGPTSTERLRNQYGLQVEQGLAQQIADDLLEDSSGSVAPTLQILLSRMWEAAARSNVSEPSFTRDLYSSMRRQGLLLRDFLNRQLTYVEERWPGIVSPDLLLDLLSLHTTALGTAEEQIIADLQKSYSHHADTLPQILDGCRDAYLLTLPGSTADDETATRLAHDTLAPLVRERFEMSDHPGQRARRILENRVIEWQDGDTGAPLDEVDLSIVEAGQAGMRTWTDDEKRLVEASRTQSEKRRAAVRVRRGLSFLAVSVIFVAVGVATWMYFHSEQLRTLAGTRESLANVQTQLAEEHRRDAQLAVARRFIEPLQDDGRDLTKNELRALWALASTNQHDAWFHCFAHAFSTPHLADRVRNRSGALVRAAVGLRSERRHALLVLIDAVLAGNRTLLESLSDTLSDTDAGTLQIFDAENLDWKVVTACAAVANELTPLQPSEAPIGKLIAKRLLEKFSPMKHEQVLPMGGMLSNFSSYIDPQDFDRFSARTRSPAREDWSNDPPNDILLSPAKDFYRKLKDMAGHTKLAEVAMKHVQSSTSASPEIRQAMLLRLSRWLYNLPPNGPTSRPGIRYQRGPNGEVAVALMSSSMLMDNSKVPGQLVNAATLLLPSASDKSKVIFVHALLHALLRKDYEFDSQEDLRRGLKTALKAIDEPANLIDLLKTPSCTYWGSHLVLEELEKRGGEKLNGEAWSVLQYRDRLKLSDEEISRQVAFPQQLLPPEALP